MLRKHIGALRVELVESSSGPIVRGLDGIEEDEARFIL